MVLSQSVNRSYSNQTTFGIPNFQSNFGTGKKMGGLLLLHIKQGGQCSLTVMVAGKTLGKLHPCVVYHRHPLASCGIAGCVPPWYELLYTASGVFFHFFSLCFGWLECFHLNFAAGPKNKQTTNRKVLVWLKTDSRKVNKPEKTQNCRTFQF